LRYITINGKNLGIQTMKIINKWSYEGAKKACWFHSVWFCHNVLPEKIIFKEMIK